MSDTWLSQFLECLAGEHGYSQHTIDAYKADLARFQSALGKDFRAASPDDIRQFILGRLTATSPKTARRQLSSIKSFYQFIFMERGLPQDPSRHIRAPKAYDAIVRPITRTE